MENQTGETNQAQASTSSGTKKSFSVKVNKKAMLFVVIVLVILEILFYFKGLFIAAVVDGKPISRFAVIKELENTSGQQALDALIIKQLINTEANKAGITVSQEDIDAEIQTLKERISKQGGTLELLLAQQGISQDQFREQISLQKELEKILGDKVQATDDEVNKYFTENKIAPPAGMSEDEIKNQIRAQLKNQKFGVEADKLVTELKAKAAIQYYVGYGKPEQEPEIKPESASESSAPSASSSVDSSSNTQETEETKN